MKLYITKPLHTRYGSIKFPKYSNLSSLLDDCIIWFFKPIFRKPVLCIFGEGFIWNGFISSKHMVDFVQYKHFPEGEVKNKIKNIISHSLKEDLSESLANRHYKWIGECEVKFAMTENIENSFEMYLTKPDIESMRFAGIDKAKVWFTKPKLTRHYFGIAHNNSYIYNLNTTEKAYLECKLFRKHPELEKELNILWNAIKNSFDIKENNDFLMSINNNNHKKGKSSNQMIETFRFILQLA